MITSRNVKFDEESRWNRSQDGKMQPKIPLDIVEEKTLTEASSSKSRDSNSTQSVVAQQAHQAVVTVKFHT